MPDSCANPLLLSWIKEWLEQARERNSKGFTVYKKAYESLKACPLRFDHPSEAQQLHGLGPKLCERLTDKMKAFCDENGLPMPEVQSRRTKRKSDLEESAASPPFKKTRKAKPYVPTLRSGAYALVLALASLEENASHGLTKPELIELAQPHCDASFSAPSDPTKFYTAWNSMKTLMSKDMVYEHGRPLRKYLLTEEGWEVAKRIQGIEKELPAIDMPEETKNNSKKDKTGSSKDKRENSRDISPPRPRSNTNTLVNSAYDVFSIDEITSSPERPFREPSTFTRTKPVEWPEQELDTGREQTATVSPMIKPILLPPGCFTVNLILDSREVRTTSDRDYISTELSKRGITTIIRALPLGDCVWVAQVKPEHQHLLLTANAGDDEEGCFEIMLDHIVERKRLDDLISSIKDGRFHEQKFRLKKSGVKCVTYIIEDFSISSERADRHGEALTSAIASMQVVNGYFVKQTGKLDDTIRYLARMTEKLRTHYESTELRVIPSKALHPQTYLPLLVELQKSSQDLAHYITFSAFSSMCSKSDTMSLRDVFLRMLMCTRGVTGEKALEIQQRWPTPRDLIEAFESVSAGGSKENLISDKLAQLLPRKKIGKALSTKIAQVWG